MHSGTLKITLFSEYNVRIQFNRRFASVDFYTLIVRMPVEEEMPRQKVKKDEKIDCFLGNKRKLCKKIREGSKSSLDLSGWGLVGGVGN